MRKNILLFALFMSIMAISQISSQTKILNENPVATVETSMGTFEIELYPADAPKTVENFIGLAEQNYFDSIRVHRVVPGFVIQTGDPNSKNPELRDRWGTGGRSIWGKEFADELNSNTQSYKDGYLKGVVAMANRGPNTNTSQFFVMLQDNTRLPKNYTIFGKVIKGIEVVDVIGKVQTNPNTQQPVEDVIVKKISIEQPAKNSKE